MGGGREKERAPEEKSKWERELARRIKCRRLNGRIVRKVRDSPSSWAARDILASPPPQREREKEKGVEHRRGEEKLRAGKEKFRWIAPIFRLFIIPRVFGLASSLSHSPAFSLSREYKNVCCRGAGAG